MFRSRLFLILILVIAGSVSAQSGRTRIVATPTPTPVAAVESQGYSESKPSTRRIMPRDDRPIATTEKLADDEEILRIETSLIDIPVSVYDRNGLYISGLDRSNFKIFEDGIEQEIEYFSTTEKPFTVALVLDVSPSASYRIEDIRQAAIAFVDQLKPQDSVIVIDFDSSVRVRQNATTDRQKIYEAINKAKYGGGTSLFNAVDEALRKRLSKAPGRKAVVLFTDGVDTTSRKNSYDSTLRYAEEFDALIFPIYYNTYEELKKRHSLPPPGGGEWNPVGTSANDYALGRRYLDEISEATGGRIFQPETTPGGLTRAFEGIAEELRRQYNIGYIPKTEGKPGQRKQIRVRVNRPDLIIRSRDSYIVGASAKQNSK